MNIKLIAGTEGDEPVTLAEAKTNLQYPLTDQDFYIQGLISAARHQGEIWNGRKFVLSQWEMALDHFHDARGYNLSLGASPYFNGWQSEEYRIGGHHHRECPIELLAPLLSVQSFTWKDIGGTVHTLTEDTDYIVDVFKEPGIIVRAPGFQWPNCGLWPTSAIRIILTAGMVPDAAAYKEANPSLTCFPPQAKSSYKQGILLLVTQWFTDRVPLDAIRFVDKPPFMMSSLWGSDKLWA